MRIPITHRFPDYSLPESSSIQRLYPGSQRHVLCGNTDDHARNHAAFWDGHLLSLMSAYDICSQRRSGNEASQAMLISGANRMSRITSCLDAAHHFLLSRTEALAIAEFQVSMIGQFVRVTCEAAGTNETDSNVMWGRQFLNPFAFDDLDGDAKHLRQIADSIRSQNL